MLGFERTRTIESLVTGSVVGPLSAELDSVQVARVNRIKQAWNFYEGYHWENLPDQDSAQLTINYCRAFVDKFVSFELSKAFTFTVHRDLESLVVTNDGRTLFQYLEDVWEDNDQYKFCTEMGQMKSVTGEAWVQVRYFSPSDLSDAFSEYPEGRLRLLLMPTSVVFPEYDPHDRDNLIKLTIMYQYKAVVTTPILGRQKEEIRLFKQVWTKDECVTYDGGKKSVTVKNRYGTIPFVLIKNLPISGRTEGRGDLDDIIPLNVELNMKCSNVSEIIDYHSAPVTIVYGAKIGNLEKGANKVWGGLPKDAKVENLELEGDMAGSSSYISDLKLQMCEIGGIPETVLGGAQAISNTSGVALQYINLPLIEKTRMKKTYTETGLETLNKMILLVSLLDGLITKTDEIPMRDFFHTEVTIPDTLPKDTLIELQQIQQEMQMGLEDREGAMIRMGRENIEDKIARIDEDRKSHPDIYGVEGNNSFENRPEINSGMMNGQTTVEQVRQEIEGQNKASTT